MKSSHHIIVTSSNQDEVELLREENKKFLVDGGKIFARQIDTEYLHLARLPLGLVRQPIREGYDQTLRWRRA